MRRFLIWFPIGFMIVLVQSYFWVPTYQEQARGNPARNVRYIEASIGDAQILNPILSSDASSSAIESKVFEGLVDRDQNLNFRGRLATRWTISEEAYFYINDQPIDGKAPATGGQIVERLRRAMREPGQYPGQVAETLSRIREVTLLPAATSQERVSEGGQDDGEGGGSGGTHAAIDVTVKAPPRVKLTLSEVDQDLFRNLEPVVGANYFSVFDGTRFISAAPEVSGDKLKSLAAQVLPATEHNPILTFFLRPDVHFHDGRLFSARDVRFTYDAIMDPRNLSPRTSDFEPVKDIRIVDPLTVRVIYKRLFSPALGTWSMGILPAHLLDAQALRREARQRGRDPAAFGLRDSRFNRAPVGCGPFRFVRWRSDQYIELARFKDYWEGPPNFHDYTYRIIPDRFTQEMEFYAGTIDSYNVQPHQVARLKADPRFQSFSGLALSYSYIGYNMRREPFNDVRVRRALTMALDRDSIIRYVLYNQGEPITGPFLKQTDYYNKDVKPLPYDPAKALELLAEAGWRRGPSGFLEKNGKPMRFTLITNQGNDIRKAVLAIAQNSWRAIGVDVSTDVLEWAVFIQERVNKLDFDALVLGWQMSIDPDLYQIWHSSQTHPGQLNFVGFKNAEADKLIVRIRQEYNHERQVALCHQLHALIASEQPYTFLYVDRWTAVLDKRIVVRTVDAAGHVKYEKIKPTKTGDYTFYFNKWVRLDRPPQISME